MYDLTLINVFFNYNNYRIGHNQDKNCASCARLMIVIIGGNLPLFEIDFWFECIHPTNYAENKS